MNKKSQKVSFLPPTDSIHYPPEQAAVQELALTSFFKNQERINKPAIKKHKKTPVNQETGREKKVQLEEENLDESEGTTLRIISAESFAQEGT
jgi:hypothetical protein